MICPSATAMLERSNLQEPLFALKDEMQLSIWSMAEINYKYIPGDFLIIRLKLIISYQLYDS